MSYRTDMVEQILTSQEAQKILQYLSPIYGESYVGLWLLQVIGMQLDDMEEWTAELALQVTPQTATWALKFWEKEYNLVPGDNWTMEQRRNNILTKIRMVAPMTPKKLTELASNAAGVPVDVKENTAKNTFAVLLRRYTENFERAREMIEEAKPAHLIYTIQIAYLILANARVNMGVGSSSYQFFRIKVVQ